MSRTAVLLALFASSSLAALGQTTFGSITGTITDATGAAVPNAHIKAIELASGYSYESQSTVDGVYAIPNLREGTYTVTATASGFSEVRATDIRLAAREIRALNLTMQVGAV